MDGFWQRVAGSEEAGQGTFSARAAGAHGVQEGRPWACAHAPTALTALPLPALLAVVACRQLGFSGGEPATWEGTGKVTNVTCSGNETSLIECDMDVGARVPQSYAFGVKCADRKGECCLC